ncbi:hypothetical protein [Staphylococcus phage SA3]|uniref:Uncharacterized protein n=7 Tax=Kayvirus TaxID=1857843 RepID=A0A3Q9R5G8_9CAUD|nr:hypothetical protein F360_gp204 [Staphylococcus phage G15]ARQ96176.1 hypothetical protein qdsa002_220 [Staphylococcus phage qdsa002]ASZ78125.1 hypothetical protein [Staphylococcus phage SA3]AUG85628.1 hypothetical protein HSA30_gp124 [Staphylococcus phage HSA30]AXU40152.1 hypothetical protein VBSavMJYL01_150 [Staphylococcus phage VB_SavM_JYL01]AZU97558.1 hypothetical protein VBSavMJYL02_146 [Staphylococcus phage VB-SavM-JYL02]QEQ93206.1 hypothetical protein [Staphylococcus phage vB_SauH_IM
MIYKISKHNYYSRFEYSTYPPDEGFAYVDYVDVILIGVDNPKKKKVITLKVNEFNSDDYKVGHKYNIIKILWFEKWEWLKP